MIFRCNLMASRVCIAAANLLLIGALSACAGPAREPVESLSELQGGNTIMRKTGQGWNACCATARAHPSR